VRLTITTYASPCVNISGSFARGDITRISQKRFPGWSRLCARVNDGGVVRVGDPVLCAILG
jgi:MOSC domain-containing protein YiiM